MSEFKSVLADEMDSFLSLYKLEVGKDSYYHAKRHLIRFDDYLCSISCTDKNLTERQIYDWLGTFNVKKSTICKYVTILRGLTRHLEGYGYRPFIPPYPKVRDDYIAYIFTDEELERIFSVADSGAGISRYYPYRDVELPVILRILYGCGMRIGEVLSLKTENLNLEIGTFILKKTKSKEYRLVPMKTSLQQIMKRSCKNISVRVIAGAGQVVFQSLPDFWQHREGYSLVRLVLRKRNDAITEIKAVLMKPEDVPGTYSKP